MNLVKTSIIKWKKTRLENDGENDDITRRVKMQETRKKLVKTAITKQKESRLENEEKDDGTRRVLMQENPYETREDSNYKMEGMQVGVW